MQFHMPKPILGWRQFFGEVGIIVLGVLIALGAEQVVHNITETRRTTEARERIKDELGTSLGLGVERLAVSPCLQDRVRELADGLAGGRGNWEQFVRPDAGDAKLALREVYHTPSRAWIDDAYRGALTQGDLSRASPRERAQLAALYKQTEKMTQLNEREQQLTTRLAVLQFDPVLSAFERHQLIQVVSELDYINALMVLIAKQNISLYHRIGGSYAWDADRIEQSRSIWVPFRKVLLQNYGSCIDESAWDQLIAATKRPVEE